MMSLIFPKLKISSVNEGVWELWQDITVGKPTWPAANSPVYGTCISLARRNPAAVWKPCSLLAGGITNQIHF